jgi:putative membrane protein
VHYHEVDQSINSFLEPLFFGLLFILIYITAVYMTNKNYKKWPVVRIILWSLGVYSVLLAIMGPIAEQAHNNFQAHMMAHLLLGMLGPLLLVLSAPMTLFLRTVPVKYGRLISKLLKSTYVKWVTHPIIATILNIGGLWLLYTSNLYGAMHSSLILFILVHIHVFFAGYVFTLSLVYIEPTPHRTSFRLRAIVLIFAMAAHSILSKWIYANPPEGIASLDAEAGGILMYYGGDAIDLVIVILLCYQYFNRSRRDSKERSVFFTEA